MIHFIKKYSPLKYTYLLETGTIKKDDIRKLTDFGLYPEAGAKLLSGLLALKAEKISDDRKVVEVSTEDNKTLNIPTKFIMVLE